MIFQGNKEEYIAEREKYFAWPAILLVFSRLKSLPETVEIQQLRKDVSEATGFPFSERAIRLALVEDGHQLGVPVSDLPKEKYFRLILKDIKNLIRVHSSQPENRLNRLQKLPHDTFRAEVSKARKEAAMDYDKGSALGMVWQPTTKFTDYIFEYLRSELANPQTRAVILRNQRLPIDWTKWGAIFTGVSIVVAIVLWKFS